MHGASQQVTPSHHLKTETQPVSEMLYRVYLEIPTMDKVLTASVVWWSEFLAADPEVSGRITGATRFSVQQLVWNGVHSALMRINEQLLERRSSGSGLKN
jgi:hypothetical protein